MPEQRSRLLQGAETGRLKARRTASRSRALMESLEPRTLLTSIPTGAVQTFNLTTISGWVFNADDGANPLNVVITIDGNATTVTANLNRPDLLSQLGSANHGFSYSVPGLATGVHNVTVDLSDPYNSMVKRLKTATLTVAPPSGSVDKQSFTVISGWAFSAANNSAPVQVVVTLDGQATTLAANLTRTDLTSRLGSANHGFSFTMPALDTGTHPFTVDVLDPSSGLPIRLRTSSIVIAAPTGSIEKFSTTQISGWTFSAADLATPNQVILTINGSQVALNSDDTRNDLLSRLGSNNHGFSYAMPALRPGSNTVAVDVVDGSTGLLKRLRSGTLSVGGPTGAVTTFNNSTISGWAFSPLEGPDAVNVVVTLNGHATTLTADQYLPSLVKTLGTAYHGFSFTVPTLPPGSSTVTVDVVDPYSGQTRRIKSGTLTNRPPTGGVDIHTATETAGWASDPDLVGPVQVQIVVNGTALSAPFTANNSRKLLGSTAIGFDVAGNFAGDVVEVFAFDQPSNQPVLIWTNNRKPRGAVNAITGFNVSGWAVDPDVPATPINVRVDIDGMTLTTVPANIARPDVQSTAGALNVGYSVAIPGLTPGKHTIAVYALDGQATSAAPVLLGSKTVFDAPPVGQVETANASVISGWALDPDLGAAAATINVYVDDALFTTATANLPRPDLVAKYGSPNHGFSVDVSSLPAGSHAVTVTAVDDRTSNQREVVIYDGFINNQQPVGLIEQVTGTTISGWAYDPDAGPNPIAVDIYVDGVFSSTVTANLPDDNATEPTPNHGFTANLPTLNFGAHRIDVYASESQGNVSVLIGSQTVTNNRPIGAIEALSGTTLTGWAADPDRLGESVQIQIYINGVLAATDTANHQRSDLATLAPLSLMPSFTHYGFSTTIPTLAPGTNQIDVYAVDLNNGQSSSLGFITVTV